MNRKRARQTTELFLMAVGAVACVSFLAALQWWVGILGALFAVSLWTIIYKFIEGLEVRASERATHSQDHSPNPSSDRGSAEVRAVRDAVSV